VLKNRLKIQFRIYGYYGLIPAVLFLLVGSTVYRGELQLSLTGYVTQSLMLIGALVGYQGGQRDKKEAGEYVYICRYSYAGQVMSVLAEWCFLTFLNLILFVYIVIFGLVNHYEAWAFQDMSAYLLIYYLFPSLFSELIGRIFGLMERSVVHFFLMGILVLLFGPMGRNLLETLMDAVLGDRMGKNIVDFVNVGQIDIGLGMDLYYGLQIESRRMVHILFFIAILFCVWSVGILAKVKCRNFFQVILPLFSLVLCVLLGLQYRIPCYLATSENSDNAYAVSYYDRLYYRDYETEEKEALFRIDRLVGTVDTRRILSFDGTLKGEILSDTSELSFRLYHDLKVKELAGDGVESYEQEGDVVHIFYRDEQKAGTPIDLTLSYEGTSSPYFYVNERAIFLPSYFNWLPCPGEGSAMRTTHGGEGMEELTPVPTFMENDVFYDLTYLGSNTAYSNLDETESSHFTGTSRTGVYLLSNNHMRTYTFANGEIVSCVTLTDEFVEKAGAYVSDSMSKLRKEQNGEDTGELRILLIPHHTFANTVSLEYAIGNTVYCDAKSWDTIQGWSSDDDIREDLESEISYALDQFGTSGAPSGEEGL
jgi:hypothetical protein